MTLPDRAGPRIRGLSLWQTRRLWSLWEMLERYALLFAASAIELSETKWMHIVHNAESNSQTHRDVLQVSLNHSLHSLKGACVLADLDNVIPEIDRLLSSLDGGPLGAPNAETIVHSLRHLTSRVQDELDAEYFFHLNRGDADLYKTDNPFGGLVADTFPLACEDIEEAAKCLALRQSTACVFHLMRAMEGAVQRLGTRLGVKNVDKEWGKILSDIGAAITKMPDSTPAEKTARNEWSEVHANLYHVKQAWRNDTMHPKQTYSPEEARNVFNAVKAFMNHLAGLV